VFQKQEQNTPTFQPFGAADLGPPTPGKCVSSFRSCAGLSGAQCIAKAKAACSNPEATAPTHYKPALAGQTDSELCRNNVISQRFHPSERTTFTGAQIAHGTPQPMTLSYHIGNDEWIVGVLDGYLKMSRIKITGSSTYTWIETKYRSLTSAPSSCKVQATFSEACYTGTSYGNAYPLNLIAIKTPCKAVPLLGTTYKRVAVDGTETEGPGGGSSSSCDGGGLWERYLVQAGSTVTECKLACNSEPTCVGFDHGATGCNIYSSGEVNLWTHTVNKALSGYNDATVTGTVDECKLACIARATCKSFDYNPTASWCHLSDSAAGKDGVPQLRSSYGIAGRPGTHYALQRGRAV